MKKIMLAAAVSGSMLLGGCTVTAQDIIAYTQQICAFTPIAATIVSIVDANIGASAYAIAQAICTSALAQKASGRFGASRYVNAPVKIGGNVVVVRGYF